MPRKSLFISLILCLCLKTQAQNLVLNPSFEMHDTCPNQMGQIHYCNSWFDGVTHGSCDYYSANNCTGDYSPPNIQFTTGKYWHATPLSGLSYAGFIPYYGNPAPSTFAEFLQGKFNAGLMSSTLYYVEFYVMCATKMKFTINNIYGLITDTIDPNNLQNYLPQISPTPNKIYSDTTKWMRINGFYLANGGEKYITIGNYTPYGQELKDSVISNYTQAYYFVDSVGVYPVTNWQTWNAGPDKTINFGDSVQIGNPCSDYSIFNWITSTNGITNLNDSTMPLVWSKPGTTTTYYVTKNQGSTVFKDTVTVFVNPTSIDEIMNTGIVSVFPNPSNEGINIKYNLTKDSFFEIKDINGKSISRYILYSSRNKLEIANPQLENGVYFYHITDGNTLSKSGKVIIMK